MKREGTEYVASKALGTLEGTGFGEGLRVNVYVNATPDHFGSLLHLRRP